MIGQPSKPAVRVLASSIWLLVAACSGAEEGAVPQSRAMTPGLSNPAVRNCLEAGHVLEPVLANGVPIGHLCVDRASGERCEVWEYFRGTCRLGPTPPPHGGG